MFHRVTKHSKPAINISDHYKFGYVTLLNNNQPKQKIPAR